jgi:hypothetical protein
MRPIAVAGLLGLTISPLSAAECGWYGDAMTSLEINEEADPQTVTFTDARGSVVVCELVPTVSDVGPLHCPDGTRTIELHNDHSGPTVFVVDGDVFAWFCRYG